jgi:hypothetical protein
MVPWLICVNIDETALVGQKTRTPNTLAVAASQFATQRDVAGVVAATLVVISIRTLHRRVSKSFEGTSVPCCCRSITLSKTDIRQIWTAGLTAAVVTINVVSNGR